MSKSKTQPPDTYAFLIINDKVFPLNRKETRIGRKEENDIVIPDRSVSRFHAEIHYQDGRYHLISQDRRTGGLYKRLQVSRKDVSSRALNSGDSFQIGGYRVIYMENKKVQVREVNRGSREYVKQPPRLAYGILQHSPTIMHADYWGNKRPPALKLRGASNGEKERP